MTNETKLTDANAEDVRRVVSDHYAAAAKTATKHGGSCCGAQTVQLSDLDLEDPTLHEKLLGQADRSRYNAMQGYSEADLAQLPGDAKSAAFGCGNPVNMAGLQPGDTVVDLGSGAGIDVILAAKVVGPSGHVIGVDMTDDMIDHARRNIDEAGLTNAEIRKGVIEDLPVDDASTDWILSNCVINLSPEKPKVFAEAFRVLKPGGRFLVSDIVLGDVPDYIRESVLGYVSCIGGAVGEAEYLRIIRDAGFDDIEVAARHTYSPQELLAFAGLDALPTCEIGEQARQILKALEGQITSIKVRGVKSA